MRPVAAEELCRVNERPQRLEFQRAAPHKLLHDRIHLLVRPLECDGPGVERNRQRAEDAGCLPHPVRLSDDEHARLPDGCPCVHERVGCKHGRIELMRLDRGTEVGRRPSDHGSTITCLQAVVTTTAAVRARGSPPEAG